MSAAAQTFWSSSPKAGAMCTMPVPSSVVTWSRGEHLPGVAGLVRLGVGEEVEQRRVAAAHQVGAAYSLDDLAANELALVGVQPRLGQQVALALVRDHDVVDVGVDGERQVAGQRPGRGGPGQCELAGVEPELDRQGRVLPLPVDVVHPGLGVGQRRLAAPAVGQHPEALVDQALVPQRAGTPTSPTPCSRCRGSCSRSRSRPSGPAARRTPATRRCSAAPRRGRPSLNSATPIASISALWPMPSCFSASTSAGRPWQSQPKRRSTRRPRMV